MEGCFMLQWRGWGGGGGGGCFSGGGKASFLSGGVPHRGGIGFDVGGFEKNRGMGGHAPYYGKHWRIRMKI